MHFYKAKYDAATPTRVQINVPTNTDYMVGTELYVKGEKKDITAENVKLKTGESWVRFSGLSAESNDDFDFTPDTSTNRDYWTSKKAFFITPNTYQVSRSGMTYQYAYTSAKNPSNIIDVKYYDGSSAYDNLNNTSSTSTMPLQFGWIVTPDGTEYIFQGIRAKSVDGYKDGDKCFALRKTLTINDFEDITGPVELPVGTKFICNFIMPSYKVMTAFSIQSLMADYLAPDTTVNGIPAFTMKSLDAEADKLYEVEFKGTNTNTTWDAALSAFTVDGDLFEYESFTNNKFRFRVLKDMTIKAPFKVVNNEYVDNGDDYTYLEGKNSANNEIYDGTLAFPDNSIVLSSATNGTCMLFAITQSDIATHSLPPKSSYFIMSAGATDVSEFALKAGDAITIAKKSGFGANAPKVNYFQVGEDAYNYKFKLFINEDEQSYGDIDLSGTTPAEVSAIVDDAIAAYDAQLSTVNLSGTFDDDSTFSYDFVIKN